MFPCFRNYSGPLEGDSRPTNNNAEIQAATKACEIARDNGKIMTILFNNIAKKLG
jgi:ribonuclease HI